jgi:hypothetical protein
MVQLSTKVMMLWMVGFVAHLMGSGRWEWNIGGIMIGSKTICREIFSCVTLYKMPQEERSVFWEVIVLVILSKKSVYVHVSYSKQFLR